MFYWFVFYAFLFFNTNTTFITHYFDGILFPLCSNGYFVSIVLSNLTVLFILPPHYLIFGDDSTSSPMFQLPFSESRLQRILAC